MKKKIISLVVCVVLCFTGLLSVPFAAESEETVYGEKAMEKLTALGILSGFSVNADTFSENVTRGEMCKVLVELSNTDSVLSVPETAYSDVSSDDEYYNYIMTASSLGYVSGRTGGVFAPGENVTVQDGLKMLLSVLGYDEYAANRGGYPHGYLEAASDVGLLKEAKGLGAEDFLTRGILAEICETALEDTALMKPVHVGDVNIFRGEKGASLLYEKHGILKDKEIVSANELTSIYSVNGKTNEGYIKIGDELFRYGGADSDELLGLECDYYYEEETGEVLYISPVSRNDVTEVSAELIEKAEDGVITYEDGNSYDKIYTDGSTSVILNGVFTGDYDDAALAPEVGRITAIDSDKDGTADVLKVFSFDTYVVDRVDINSGTVYDKFGKAPLKLPENENNYLIKFGAQTVELSALEEWDVLEVGANKVKRTEDGIRADADNADFYYIIALNDRVIGSLTEVSEKKCKIEGVEFRVDAYFRANEKTEAFSPGKAGNFLLGYGDRIVAVRYDETTEVLYGFLFNAYIAPGVSEDLQFELFDQNGNHIIADAAPKMRFNNEYKLTPAEVYDKLPTAGTNGNKHLDMLIRFRLNSKKQVTELYTFTDKTQIKGYKGYSEDEFTKDYVVNNLVYRAGNHRLFAGKYQINSDLTVFYVPMSESGAQKEYVQIKNSDYFEGNLYYSDVEFFDVTKERSVTVALVRPSVKSFLTNESPVMVVDELTSAVLPDGSIGIEINGFSSGKEASVSAEDSNLSDIGDWGQKSKTLSELKRGDVIQYAKDKDGVILSFRVLFSNDKDMEYFEKAAGGTVAKDNYYAVIYTGFGKIREVNETNIIFNGNTDSPDLICADPEWDRTIPYAGGGIYKYDAETDRLRLADKSELFEGYDVFVYTHLTNTKEIILFAD